MSCAVYQIRNVLTGHVYIGSSNDTDRRWLLEHRGELRRGQHANIHLQRAWNRDGEDSFIFEILEECSELNLISREQYYLDTVRKTRQVYNMSLFVDTPLRGRSGPLGTFYGRHHTEEHKRRMSEKLRGRKFTDEHRQHMCESARGKKLSDEHKRKIGDSVRGVKNGFFQKQHSDETKAKMKLRWTPERRLKARLRVKGVNNPMAGVHPVPWNKGKTYKCTKKGA